MNPIRQIPGSIIIAAGAGLMDSLTGLLLCFWPAFTLSLMGIEAGGESLVYIRFIGAFVLGVGSLYLLGLGCALRRGQWRFLRSIFWATAWIRSVIFLFGMIAIAGGELAVSWTSVPVTDILVAMIQVAWLLKGGIPVED